METFSALLALCVGNSPVTGEFPAQRPVTRSFDVLFYLRLNKRLSKQSGGLWFETPSRPLWRHCNEHMGSITGWRFELNEAKKKLLCRANSKEKLDRRGGQGCWQTLTAVTIWGHWNSFLYKMRIFQCKGKRFLIQHLVISVCDILKTEWWAWSCILYSILPNAIKEL